MMTTTPENPPPPPLRAAIILVLGLLATWLAAGSLGWLAPPLQRTLTWLAFAAIIIAALPGPRQISVIDGLLLGGATSIAVLLTASSSAVVNILAVAILLAAIAQLRPAGTVYSWPAARVAAPAALAATVLALFRLVCDGSAAAWTFANGVGRVEGQCVGWMTGRPLLIGASFGGLDFLVVMAALIAAWLSAAPGPGVPAAPRIGRAVRAMLFVLLAQTAYLVVLAFSHDVTALLPPQIFAKPDDVSHLGIWTWGNALHVLLPWNLPLLAAVFQSAVAVALLPSTSGRGAGGEGVSLPSPFGRGAAATSPGEGNSLPSPSGRGAGGEGSAAKRRNRILPHDRLNSMSTWRRFGPAGLMVAAAVALTLAPVKPDLKDRRIVAYDDGTIDWTVKDPGAFPPGRFPRYGLLPALVESLGGQFKRSRELADLQDADVLIVLPPGSAATPSIPAEIQKRIWAFVSDGGRLIVAGEPETNLGVDENVLNGLLTPTAMSFRDDTANSLTLRWEDNLQSAPQAATAGSSPGRSHFSFDRAASIRVSWPAGPLVVGRWAWDELGTDPERPDALPYSPGDHLGDLVLAAQQNVGRGKVVVLGSAACLSNDGIPFSYTFAGPLLSALAAQQATPLAWWRQLLGLAAAGAAIAILLWRVEPLPIMVASLALALTVIACHWLNNATAELLPSGNKTAARPVIYVDGSHLEAMGTDPWGENGIGRLMRVLAASDYLPLVAPDVARERLSRAAMLISIAPARAFRQDEIEVVNEFVEQGGFFLSTVGSPEAEPSRALLEKLELHIKPVPEPPWVGEPETTPLGRFGYPSNEQASVEIYAGWPVSGPRGAEVWSKPVMVGRRISDGQAYLIGDTAFALNKNFDSFSPNRGFWSAQLKNWLGR